MNKLFIICALVLLSCSDNEARKKEVIKIKSAPVISPDTCIDFNSLNNKIRDGLISKSEALNQFQILLPEIKNYFYKHNGVDYDKLNWVFPLQGYSAKAIGGSNGNGYIATGYNYFDGNKHLGHPAHDIFINDKNQDCLDDVTGKEVNVLSITGGIVIAEENNWNEESNLRGGKYILIYDPGSNSLFYYAHNNKILIKLCDIVKPGDVIATVGRTGFSAFKKRSPTHLHIMQLKLDNDYYPTPFNCYKDLITITTR